jgi:hypothetical protein
MRVRGGFEKGEEKAAWCTYDLVIMIMNRPRQLYDSPAAPELGSDVCNPSLSNDMRCFGHRLSSVTDIYFLCHRTKLFASEANFCLVATR